MQLLKYSLSPVKNFISRFWKLPITLNGSVKIFRSDLLKILANWQIGPVNSLNRLSGGSNTNWLVKTSSGDYVLRQAGTNRDYLEFQIFIINKLKTSTFPYATPQLIATEGSYYISYQDHLWLLYRFIEGSSLKTIYNSQAHEMGRLVASYHQIAQTIDYSHLGDFSLALFETERIKAIFQESTQTISGKKSCSPLEDLLAGSITSLLEAYNHISSADKRSIKHLEKIPIYNDWYSHNILSVQEKIIGLIDFDSLVVAPRIVDIQNGLFYAAATNQGLDLSKMQAFIQGYCSVLPLSQFELSLIYPLMIERVATIISDLLAQKNVKNNSAKDDILIFLIKALTWIIENKQSFTRHLLREASNLPREASNL